jgi:uncharacterized protein
MTIPSDLTGKKYILLGTLRKNGTAVQTPLWFAERDGKLYFMTRNDSWKYKRIRNNPQVTVAPCTARGTITGPGFSGHARILPPSEWPKARDVLARKYWLMRLPFWSKRNEFIEIEFGG